MKNLDGLPFDREAEQQLLSALLAGPDYIFKVASDISPNFFFNEDHRAIYSKMVAKAQAGETIEEVTFINGESDERQLILQRLYDNAFTGTTAPHWARKVRECAYAREIFQLGNSLVNKASDFEGFQEADSFLREAVERVLSSFNVADTDTYSPAAISDICQTIQDRRDNPGIHGIKTLFPILDRVVKGLKLINIIAAPSGFGKTALALQWAWNIGVVQGIPTLYVNYEMGEDELLERMLACGSGVDLNKIQLGETDDQDNELVSKAREKLKNGKLFITGCEEKTIDHTINLIHQYRAQHQTQLVFIDYIGEIGRKQSEYDTHTYALYGHWVQMIKNTCSQLGMKSVLLAQLNRQGYEGAPGPEAMGDSMQIIHKAHLAIAFYLAKDGRPHLKTMKNRGGAIVQPIPINYTKNCQQITEAVF